MSNPGRYRLLITAGLAILFPCLVVRPAQPFRVATFNLENYLEASTGNRPAKSAESKAKVRESIRLLNADVIALQEVGSESALLELRAGLSSEGADYPHWELVSGFDTNIFLVVLSKFPFLKRQPHTNESFLLNGRRFRVSRGFAEVDIEVNPGYRFTLVSAHLKSRRATPEADESDLREQEALLLREKIDARLSANPNLNLIVLGDFNDTKDSKSMRVILGRGKNGLVDTRPAECNGQEQQEPASSARNITWTHYYAKEDTYSRIDYIFLSRGMAKEWLNAETFVLNLPEWGVASDHRPVAAGFMAEEN
jgi:endonuclease/exonuclease/phosphatase family metal-dependent hydrolase